MNAETIDGFAGPGGWDEAARQLGLDPLGIEIDDAACATRRARGHRTLQADLTALDPLEFAPVKRMIFSPPCPSFSMAGKGEGRSAIPLYQEAMVRMAVEGKSVDRAALDEVCGDPRAHLILEPLRWALALRPEWVACEQVEPCLPLWETLADCLRHVGYMTWTGVLSAECYGVPQTRRRAFLLASLTRQPERPAASHQRYVPPRVKPRQEEALFEAPEPERIVLPEDRHLLPWVSMAEALGWGMTARPYLTVASGRESGGPDKEKVGGSAAREVIYDEQEAGRWACDPRAAMGRGHDTGERVWVTDTPACGCCWDWIDAGGFCACCQAHLDDPDGLYAVQGDGSHGMRDCPARTDLPTHMITGQSRNESWVNDRPAPTIVGGRRSDKGMLVGRQLAKGEGRNVGGNDWREGPPEHARGMMQSREREAEPRDPDWPSKRPATTVAGDPRLAQPGHKNEEAMPECPGRMEGAVRVSIEEAAVLQGFPPDYPWQGSRTAIYRQIGDAVPPPLARAVLAELER